MGLTELCQELKNWFEREKYIGTFTITDGEISVPDGSLQDGQFFRVIGSVFNDGVHRYGSEGGELTDEVFKGAIWAMAVPPAVIDLSERISEWNTKYGEAVSSPYSSESFGGYSYQKASSGRGNAESGAGPSWQSTFANELNHWRKI
jgi:hypothetical protein